MTELQVISKLSDSEQQPPTALTSVHVKTPRRILHFSDGIMEEYSTDDEVDGKNKDYKNDEVIVCVCVRACVHDSPHLCYIFSNSIQ